MIKNSTVEDNTTTIVELTLTNYDTNGAIIYIIIVLLWYSIGIAFLLGMDTLAHSEEIEDSARRRARFLIRNLRDQTNTKEILEELVDKQNRNRLWDIYLGTALNTKHRLTRAETIRIRHLEKQLATIKRNHRITHDTVCSSTNDLRYIRSQSEYRPDTDKLSSEAVSTSRRRSSLDQQTLDRLKELSTLSKPYEQLPWAIRKLMMRRSLRRNTKKSLAFQSEPSYTTIPTTNNEQTDLLLVTKPFSKLSHGRTESDLSTITSTISERQNPYTSYFYIPSNQPLVFTTDFSS